MHRLWQHTGVHEDRVTCWPQHLSSCVMLMVCRDLFIEMHFGPKRYVDPEPFANSLLLDHAIQQVGTLAMQLASQTAAAVAAAATGLFSSSYLANYGRALDLDLSEQQQR